MQACKLRMHQVGRLYRIVWIIKSCPTIFCSVLLRLFWTRLLCMYVCAYVGNPGWLTGLWEESLCPIGGVCDALVYPIGGTEFLIRGSRMSALAVEGLLDYVLTSKCSLTLERSFDVYIWCVLVKFKRFLLTNTGWWGWTDQTLFAPYLPLPPTHDTLWWCDSHIAVMLSELNYPTIPSAHRTLYNTWMKYCTLV